MTVLPEPERGAAMMRPLAKAVLPQRADVPVEIFAQRADCTHHDDGRRDEHRLDALDITKHPVDHILIGQRGVADDGDAVGGRAAGEGKANGGPGSLHRPCAIRRPGAERGTERARRAAPPMPRR